MDNFELWYRLHAKRNDMPNSVASYFNYKYGVKKHAGANGAGYDLTKWSDISRLIGDGKAPQYLPLGYQLTAGGYAWDVLDHDHDNVVDALHSVPIQMHDCFADATLEFSPRQAFYATTTGLTAGKYNFTVEKHPWASSSNGKTYSFLLTKNLPAGGQIVFDQAPNDNLNNSDISTYASPESKTRIEQVTMIEDANGTALGTIGLNINGEFNAIQRALNGSNNWKESPIRQWLNSSAEKGSVWTAQTKWDRPPLWVNTLDGFMRNLEPDFLKFVGVTHNITARNTISDGGGYDETDDYFFFVSRSQVYSGNEKASINEGFPYAFYEINSSLSSAGVGADLNKQKKKLNTSQWYWLRTPNVNYANTVRTVNSGGAITGLNSVSSGGVSVACNLI